MAAAPLQLKYETPPSLAYTLHKEFNDSENANLPEHSNFLKGVKWSPDGIALLTAADDNWLRIYDTPLDFFNPGFLPPAAPAADTLTPCTRIHAGELIYDYCWFSQATASDPSSWCLATTSRAHPVHIWDALTGELRCSYRSYNAVDEPTAAYSVAFDPLGTKLYSGHIVAIHVFNIERPGREYNVIQTHVKGGDGVPGIISCIAFAPDGSGLMAAGAYSGAAALYDSRTQELLYVLEGHTGGVTHLKFSADGNYLYTGARRDGAVHCWDARYASGVVYTLTRPTTTTNQRIYFDIEPCGRHLASGGEDGCVHVYDLRNGSETMAFAAAADTVNGVEYHPHLGVLATGSGHRRYPLAPDSDHDDDINSTSSSSGSGSEDGIGNGAGEVVMEVDGRDGGVTVNENVLRLWCLESEELRIEGEGDEGQGRLIEAT